jgi:hypothetical protein
LCGPVEASFGWGWRTCRSSVRTAGWVVLLMSLPGTATHTPESELKAGILRELGWSVRRLAFFEWEQAVAAGTEPALLQRLCPPTTTTTTPGAAGGP